MEKYIAEHIWPVTVTLAVVISVGIRYLSKPIQFIFLSKSKLEQWILELVIPAFFTKLQNSREFKTLDDRIDKTQDQILLINKSLELHQKEEEYRRELDKKDRINLRESMERMERKFDASFDCLAQKFDRLIERELNRKERE